MKMTLEECNTICIGDLQKSIKKIVFRDHPGSTEEEYYARMDEEFRKFRVDGQSFEYIGVKNYLGGYRWFFLCPECKKHSIKLFLPPDNSKKIYVCKDCVGLKNHSSIMGQNKFYKNVTRPLMLLKKIEEKLERGHLSNERIQKLLDQYDQIEKDMKNAAEYRLYIFKKKHGLEV